MAAVARSRQWGGGEREGREGKEEEEEEEEEEEGGQPASSFKCN